MFIVDCLEHVGNVLFDDLAFVGPELYVSVLFLGSCVIGISQHHSCKGFSLFHFDGFEEFLSGSELFFEEFLLFTVFFDKIEVFQSVVLFEKIRLNKFPPDVVEVKVISSVGKVDEVGGEAINN
jgi:hypothetical protein